MWSKRAQGRVAKHRSLLVPLCGLLKERTVMQTETLQGRWVLDGKYFQVVGGEGRLLAFYVDYQTRLWAGYNKGMLWNAAITAGQMAALRGAMILRARGIDTDPIAALGCVSEDSPNGDAWVIALDGAVESTGCDTVTCDSTAIQNAVHAAGVVRITDTVGPLGTMAINSVLGWLPVGLGAYVDVEVGVAE